MNRLRKWWRLALVLVAVVIASQVGVSLLARTHRVHTYLVEHLERAFGRRVEVRHFNVLLLPSPRLDADQVTIGEDPAFGNEYFLRAEHLTAGLRWTGLLRGHFEFGTLSLSRPSLILVRNGEGRWNLERWLPPAKIMAGSGSTVYGPQSAVAPANRLSRIDIDDGRIDFKIVEEKLPFAFISVSGAIEQVSAGRWQLQLEAQPWRSGDALQSAGNVVVRGDVAGTSARLQPAEIHVHWDRASLADLLRLFRGRDYGVRGLFALDATAKSGAPGTKDSANRQPGEWSYELQARSTQIHRWDLTERPDNPHVNVNLLGRVNVTTGIALAERIVVETPKSNLRGTARAAISASANLSWEVHLDSAGVQAADVLAWCRAFHPNVDDAIMVNQYFTGQMSLRGWPLQLEDAVFSSDGGEARVPGLTSPVRIGAVQGGRQRDQFTIEPVRLSYGPISTRSEPALASSTSAKRRAPNEGRGVVNIGLTHNFDEHAGHLTIDGHIERVADVLKVASVFGRPLNFGWEFAGGAGAALRWEWNDTTPRGRWNGRVDVARGELQAAGLNQPLQLVKTSLEWKDGLRTAMIGDIEGFGGVWSGTIAQVDPADADGSARWNFQLHADRLDATELDRWIGPRARPGWLQRLLPSLLGGSTLVPTPSAHASELVRRVNAEGELQIDDFTLEKLKFEHVRVVGALHDLNLEVREAHAQWAGGTVHARVAARFLPRPAYDVAAALDGVDLSQLPAPTRAAERFGGSASGTLHFTTQGVGRDELLGKLAGGGDVRMRNIVFRGWDVSASVSEGEPRIGASRWAAGEGAFTLRDKGVVLAGLRLESGREFTFVKGTVSFGRDADLTIQTTTDGRRESRTIEPGHILKISGPLDLPRVSIERTRTRQPAD
jgi:AsmA family